MYTSGNYSTSVSNAASKHPIDDPETAPMASQM
jgi:hypothetical protein